MYGIKSYKLSSLGRFSLPHEVPDSLACGSASGMTGAGLSQPEVELADQLVVVELGDRAAVHGNAAVHDDIAAVGDADRLGEVLFGHQHGELVLVLQLLDGVDGARHQQRRQA